MTLSLGKAAREWINQAMANFSKQIYTPNANMADHLVSAWEELHECKLPCSSARCFVLTKLPQKSLVLLMIWCVFADHLVSAWEELHESKVSWTWRFVLTMLPQKSLVSLIVWGVLFCYTYEFLYP